MSSRILICRCTELLTSYVLHTQLSQGSSIMVCVCVCVGSGHFHSLGVAVGVVMVVAVPHHRIIMATIPSRWHLVLNVPLHHWPMKWSPLPREIEKLLALTYSRRSLCSVPHALCLDLGQRHGLASVVKGL